MARDKRQSEVGNMQQMTNLRVFHDVARALTSKLELEPLLRTIMTKMAEFFGPERWSLLMVDEETNDMFYALSAGLDAAKVRHFRIRMGDGVAGWVAQTGNPLVVPHVQLDPHWSRFSREHPELGLRSIACLPIRWGDQTLGVMQLHNSKLDLLPDYSISFLRVLCDYAAIAMNNARQLKLIHHLSITDDCTGLFNARFMYEVVGAAIGEAAADASANVIQMPQHFSLVFLDLDRFKLVNDTHGHLVGSRLLAEVGSLIKRTIGPDHAAFRYGGDEFVIMLRGLDKGEALALTQQLRQALNQASFANSDGLDLRMTASFGMATFPQDGATVSSIMRSADVMMYRVKGSTRNDIAVAQGEVPPSPLTALDTASSAVNDLLARHKQSA
jgi:diguanylate cyclase (GGDEF)-like protein